MAGTLQLERETEAAIQRRLRRIEGQTAGLQRMLAERRDCVEIAQQFAVARAALDRVAMDLLVAGLEQCLGMDLDGPPHAPATLAKLKRTFLMLK
jgi:CsoR family transcriptional regulator, copper-sensing transcriptional repressor